jgi:hypothetical protein
VISQTDKTYTFPLQEVLALEPQLEGKLTSLEARARSQGGELPVVDPRPMSFPFLTHGDAEAPVLLVHLPPDAAPFVDGLLSAVPEVMNCDSRACLVFDAGNASLSLDIDNLEFRYKIFRRVVETGRLILIVRAADTLSVVRLTTLRLGSMGSFSTALQAASMSAAESRKREACRIAPDAEFDAKRETEHLEWMLPIDPDDQVEWLKEQAIDLCEMLFESDQKTYRLQYDVDHLEEVRTNSWRPSISCVSTFDSSAAFELLKELTRGYTDEEKIGWLKAQFRQISEAAGGRKNITRTPEAIEPYLPALENDEQIDWLEDLVLSASQESFEADPTVGQLAAQLVPLHPFSQSLA